jgi:hypothetical protein
MVEEEQDDWMRTRHMRMSAMRRALLTLIHSYYLEAILRLPVGDHRDTPRTASSSPTAAICPV